MFLNDKDYYQLRSISLSDLLDSQNAIMLTSRIILEAKKKYAEEFLGLVPTKKRRMKNSEEDARVVFQFEHEGKLHPNYVDGRIQLEESSFIAINVKELLKQLDLKKEVVLTMLNQLENQGFYKLHSNLHIGLTLRFHSKTLETL